MVAKIVCNVGFVRYIGSGFMTSAGLVTAFHVVRRCAVGQIEGGHITVTLPYLDGRLKTFYVKIKSESPEHDLALLQTGNDFRQLILPLARSTPRLNEIVDLIGYPGDDLKKPDSVYGPISPVEAPEELTDPRGQPETLPDELEVVLSGVKPGESGGPAINASGQVVGVIEGSGGGIAVLTPVAFLATLG